MRGTWRRNAGSRRRSLSRAKERKPRGNSRVHTLPSTTKACGRSPARTQRKGRLRCRAKASKWRLVWATPFTSWNESGKYATRGAGAIITAAELAGLAAVVDATDMLLLTPPVPTTTLAPLNHRDAPAHHARSRAAGP